MAGGNPTATTPVEWIYKTGPGRADQLAEESDVAADSPGNQNDARIPMHLSFVARSAGWSALFRGSRVRINAAKLESFLRNYVYGGRSFWRLVEPPILYGVLLLIATLAARDWFVETARKEKAGRSVRWVELLPESGQDRRPERRRSQRFVRPRILPIALSKDILKRVANTVFQAMRKGGGRRAALVGGFRSGVQALSAEFAPSSTTAMQPKASLRSGKEMRLSATIQHANQNRTAETNNLPSSSPKKRAKRHLIFPGAPIAEGANPEPRSWDESQWID
jgi:hypothetical protein